LTIQATGDDRVKVFLAFYTCRVSADGASIFFFFLKRKNEIILPSNPRLFHLEIEDV